MKIASVEAIPLEAQIETSVARARQSFPLTARRSLLVKIKTDEGIIGYGEGLTPLAPQVPATIVRDVFVPFLVKEDPIHTESIWEKLYMINSSRGYTRGYQMIAISAVDMALWDLKGKIIGQPVYALLGGKFLERIPVYVTGLMLEKETGAVVEKAHQFYEQGFKAMKLKIGGSYGEDLRKVKALRDAFGPELTLMVDANGAYDPVTAVKIGKRLEEYNVFWFEEPVTPEDVEGMAGVRNHLNLYIAAGECEYTKYGFRDLLMKGAMDICQPDVSRAGGITECRRISALTQAFNLYYAPHAWGGALCLAASAHLSASMPNFLFCELDQVPNPLRDELPIQPLAIESGSLLLPEAPGLGVDVDENAIRRFTI